MKAQLNWGRLRFGGDNKFFEGMLTDSFISADWGSNKLKCLVKDLKICN